MREVHDTGDAVGLGWVASEAIAGDFVETVGGEGIGHASCFREYEGLVERIGESGAGYDVARAGGPGADEGRGILCEGRREGGEGEGE